MRRKRRSKTFTQYSMSIGRFFVRIRVSIYDTGGFQRTGEQIEVENTKTRNTKRKDVIRGNDRSWVHNHIPSSIAWKTQIHHDWENGGIMYLLTRGEHILRHRSEK